MKLPHRRRKPAPVTAEPPDVGPAVSETSDAIAAVPEPVPASAAVPALQVLIFSNTGLPEEEFRAQTAMLRRVASFDGETRSWYVGLPLDDPERVAGTLTALFEAARFHGTTIQVGARPAGENSSHEQAP